MCAAPVVPELLDAYRTGAGVPYTHYGRDHVEGQGAFNRASFSRLLATEWLPVGAPDVHARLQGEPPSRVLDVACGVGWSSIALAQAYPLVQIDAVDADPASIDEARGHAVEAGVAGRVKFVLGDAADSALGIGYDVAFIFEALHDMSRPVEVLAGIRARLAPGGTLIVMDERAGETFTAPGDELERFLYSASVLCCLPVGRWEQPSAATGTVLRPETVRRYAREAGFASVEVLPVEHDFFRFYRLAPPATAGRRRRGWPRRAGAPAASTRAVRGGPATVPA
jgi:2-polyprenyl-3-methyl-5-hydroxy-6-metoxy-1,4-benzoquinol methylase